MNSLRFSLSLALASAALVLYAGGAGAQTAEPCCAPVMVSGSESSALPPASRTFRVWVEPEARLFGWRRSFVTAAADAFAVWSGLDLPVEFEFVSDSSQANLLLFWRQRFPHDVRGRSTWWTSGDTGFMRGEIEVAVAPTRDWRPTDAFIRAITMHEIGHLLGLRHDHDGRSIMARTIRVTGLTPRDIRRARDLYAEVPPAGELPAAP